MMTAPGAMSPAAPVDARMPESSSAPPLDRQLMESPLMRLGGYQVIPWFYGEEGVRALLAEARALASSCRESSVSAEDTEDYRGGNPARKFLSCGAGPVQDHCYRHPSLIGRLAGLTGLNIRPTGSRGTYTFYARAGDHLAVHRDIRTCDLAVVTCLADAAPPDSGSGLMEFYPTRLMEPLGAIRRTPDRGRVRRRLRPGETAVMFGGVLPHAIAPVEAGGGRIVSVLCYETG